MHGTAAIELRKVLFLSIVTYAVLASWFALAGPRVPEAGGLGWDGQEYARMVGDLGESAAEVDSYRLARFLPSQLAWLVLSALGVTRPSPDQIVAAFAFINLALMLGIGACWLAIAREARFASGTTLIGFVGLMFSFAQIREPFFLAVTTDSLALLLGTASVYAYIARRRLALVAVSLAAIVTWPTSLPVSIAMLAMPAPSTDGTPAKASPPSVMADWLDRILRWGAVPVYLAAVVHHVYLAPIPMPSRAVEIVYPLAPLSILIALAWVAWVASSMRLYPILRWSNFSRSGIVAAACVALAYSIAHAWADAAAATVSHVTWEMLLRLASVEPVVRPGMFAAAHFVYWGPVIFLVVASLPGIARFAAGYPAVLATVVLFCAFFPFTESRWLAYFLPATIFATCGALQREADLLTPRRGLLLLLFGIIASRFWVPMRADVYGYDFSQFPAQYLFMQLGPWMSEVGYALAITQAALSCLAMHWLLWGGTRPAASIVVPQR